jgi:hypothetical protein
MSINETKGFIMDKFKRVALDENTYNDLVIIAHENGRTISGQLRLMVEAWAIMHIQSVITLEHPEDGNPVPVINVNKKS